MSQEEYSPTLAPIPTPQITLIQEDSLHLTPEKRTPNSTASKSEVALNSTKALAASLAENKLERHNLEQKLGFLESKLQQQVQKKATISATETIFTTLPAPTPILPTKKLPDLPPRQPPPAELKNVLPRPGVNVVVDPPYLEKFAGPVVRENRYFLYDQFRDLGIL
ncbi:uncharacterized protein LOC134814404 [Bolinopsis microptera]|uniref:uncharacterized protein LOC134814404 n=1 Tax=Bolinopsis microptera TaxID=2820187 RepID=UPI00307972BD